MLKVNIAHLFWTYATYTLNGTPYVNLSARHSKLGKGFIVAGVIITALLEN